MTDLPITYRSLLYPDSNRRGVSVTVRVEWLEISGDIILKVMSNGEREWEPLNRSWQSGGWRMFQQLSPNQERTLGEWTSTDIFGHCWDELCGVSDLQEPGGTPWNTIR